MPSLQNSAEWRARLMTLEESVLRADGSVHGILKSKLRHLSWAPQRWESTTCPLRARAALVEDESSEPSLTSVMSDLFIGLKTRPFRLPPDAYCSPRRHGRSRQARGRDHSQKV